MIFEPSSSGHRMQYVRRMVEGALERKSDLPISLVTLKDSEDHPAFQAMREAVGGQLRVQFFPETEARVWRSSVQPLKRLKYYIATYRLYSRFYQSLQAKDRPDHILVPYADHIGHTAALFGTPFQNTPWSGLIMTPTFHLRDIGAEVPTSKTASIKRALYFRLIAQPTLRNIYYVDYSLYHYTISKRPELAAKLYFVSEQSEFFGNETRQSARSKLGISADEPVLLIYGSLTKRKGIDSLLNASREPSFPNNLRLLFAGPQNEEVKAMLASPNAQTLRAQGRLYELDTYLVDEDEQRVFKAADMVWLGYRDFYSTSAVLLQSATMNLPVIACNEGLIGWFVKRDNFGLRVDVGSPGAVASALNRLTNEPDLARSLGANGDNLVNQFKKSIGVEAIIHEMLEDKAPMGVSF